MKYNIIKIFPVENKWSISVYLDNMERVEEIQEPNPNGFYACRKDIPISMGIRLLKDAMVNAHQKEINRLILSMGKIEEVMYE